MTERPTGLSLPRKIALTAIITVFITVIGVAYQFYYLEERSEYEAAIRDYAIKARGHAPDDRKLSHLAVLALDRYGLTEVHRMEEDYRVLFEGEGA